MFRVWCSIVFCTLGLNYNAVAGWEVDVFQITKQYATCIPGKLVPSHFAFLDHVSKVEIAKVETSKAENSITDTYHIVPGWKASQLEKTNSKKVYYGMVQTSSLIGEELTAHIDYHKETFYSGDREPMEPSIDEYLYLPSSIPYIKFHITYVKENCRINQYGRNVCDTRVEHKLEPVIPSTYQSKPIWKNVETGLDSIYKSNLDSYLSCLQKITFDKNH